MFNYSTSNRTIDGKVIYSNSYEQSHILSWLNDSLYNTVFNTEEKLRILTTYVDNSVASTGYTSNQYDCANTNGNVFLLTYCEATSVTYG